MFGVMLLFCIADDDINSTNPATAEIRDKVVVEALGIKHVPPLVLRISTPPLFSRPPLSVLSYCSGGVAGLPP